MLVLGRKPTESIVVAGNIRITLVRSGKAGARIGIEAPAGVPIVRAELLNGSQAAGSNGAPQAAPAESVRERLLDNSAACSASPVPAAPFVPSVPRPTWPAPVPR